MFTIRQRLRAGETAFGSWLVMGSSVSAEIEGSLGFDWLLIDMEHGTIDEGAALQMMQAMAHSGTIPLVRVESHARQRINRMLDMGAQGIMIPQIRTVDEAREAMNAMRYPPEGTRGVARMVRATRFGMDFQEYYESTREGLVGIIQIENEQVLDHLDEIAALPGVDVLFIGPSDMTMGMGIFRQFEHPRFQKAVQRTVEAANNAGKAAGVLVGSRDELPIYRDLGYRFVAMGSDAAFVASAATRTLQMLHEQFPGRSKPPLNKATGE